MIPTLSKSRLPEDLSWPIGAQQLSDELEEAPHVEDMTLTYSDPQRHPSFYKPVALDTEYPVLRFDYAPPHKDAPGWTIIASPVPSSWRAQVRRLLVEQALPEVRQWLQDSTQRGWLDRGQTLEIFFENGGPSVKVKTSDSL